MLETVMHIGTEHPNLLWLAGAALLTFAAGLGIGLASRGQRAKAPAGEAPADVESEETTTDR